MDSKSRVLILRTIPYNDTALIVKGFSADDGLITYLSRRSLKSSKNLIRSGSFVNITSHQKGNSLPYVKECLWDPDIPSGALPHNYYPVWLFTIELLYKSLVENIYIPKLYNRIQTYYISILVQPDTDSPLIPLLLIMEAIGLTDTSVLKISDNLIRDSLSVYGIDISQNSDSSEDELFKTELDKFCNHFDIKEVETLSLL